MSKGSPSMVALLGLMAVAGYQNRDKLSALLQPAGDRSRGDDLNLSSSGQQSGGGIVDNLRQMLGNSGSGGIAGGLSELLGRFSNPGQTAKANSWVQDGPNEPLAPEELDTVLDEETIADLMQTTGLNRTDLMARLSAVLPEAVNELTPEGRLPTPDQARAAY